ncbi:hypothetical protein DITRI_Ditri05aG0106300 [Diplodiscus trichospermus]
MYTVTDQMLQCPPRTILPIDSKLWKPHVELAPNCPRCASANTKFCYYNNYSLSQPRYFCKGCRRYWTKGGSLRNVPVGGGYRKNRRRSKPRAEKSGQVSMNYSKNSSSFGSVQEEMIWVSNSSDVKSGNQPGTASGSSDIDLSVVFAKFLNQSTCFDQPEMVTQESPIEANEAIDVWCSLEQDTNSQNVSPMECQKPVLHSIPESYMLQEMPQVKQQLQENNSIEELPETDHTNAFGIQNLLADEMVQDALWSADAATTPNFEWQPMAQLQQFESFPADDQLMISANLMTENWGSFDLSGFGVFSKS